MKKGSTDHYLSGCRADVWYRLLRQNHFSIDPECLPQALLITGASTALYPMAKAEELIYKKRIAASRPTRDPIFVLGHWRSGTTYLQNMLSRDPQFGWFDPVSTVTHPYSLLLRRLVSGPVEKGIAAGRPMDNVQYSMDSPMEETFAFLTVSPWSIINILAFPENYRLYMAGAFVKDLSDEERRKWMRNYSDIINKLTYINHGKQLILKSPDNTARVGELLGLYPDARFLNIHRDPYVTIRSTINMFLKQIELSRLSRLPDDWEETMEDVIIELFGRMYREFLPIRECLSDSQIIDIPYAEFCKEPVVWLEKAYGQLGLEGFDEARPLFEAYAESQKNYKKNKFDYPARLRKKINERLGFYFEHYGYPMQEAED